MGLSDDISRAIRQALRDGLDTQTLIDLITDLLAPYRLDQSWRDALIQEALQRYDWLRDRSAPPGLLRAAALVMDRATRDYARMRGRIQERLVRRMRDALAAGATRREIEREIRPLLGRLEHYSFTIANTSLGAFDRIDSFRSAQQAGITRYRYVGPTPLRPFCREHYRRVYTWEEIQRLDNGQGLPVWIYGGGWNCRHRWVAASD